MTHTPTEEEMKTNPNLLALEVGPGCMPRFLLDRSEVVYLRVS